VSGVPQGSVLESLLFLNNVNELPCLIKSKIKLFADDTKVWRVIISDADFRELQNDIDLLQQWTEIWLLKLDKEKCKHEYRNGSSSNWIRLK